MARSTRSFLCRCLRRWGAIDRAIQDRVQGSVPRSRTGTRMDRHCATRRLRCLTREADISTQRMHPHMLRHTSVTTMLDAGVDLRDVQIAARDADPRTSVRYDRRQEPRPTPQRHPRRVLGLRDIARTCRGQDSAHQQRAVTQALLPKPLRIAGVCERRAGVQVRCFPVAQVSHYGRLSAGEKTLRGGN
jgi:hypothetical protein